jgi:pimeloyl-ACP methyl ester carboxylesterase
VAEISEALYRAGSGEQVVLLHGFTGAWHHWRPLLGELVARYEVIAPTLAGHAGGPPFDTSRPLTFAAAADSLEGHLDELGIGSAHLVGNSMGGALALELAKRGRALTVVALAPGGGWNEGDGEADRLARFFARQIRIARALAPRLHAHSKVLGRSGLRRLALRDMMRHGDLVSPPELVAITKSAARCTIVERGIEALRADRGLMLADLDRISCPVLLASPQFDRILPAELHAPRLRREIPGVESRMLAGCGHVPMWDDAELVVKAISEFVDRHGQAALAPTPSATAATSSEFALARESAL